MAPSFLSAPFKAMEVSSQRLPDLELKPPVSPDTCSKVSSSISFDFCPGHGPTPHRSAGSAAPGARWRCELPGTRPLPSVSLVTDSHGVAILGI